MPIVWTTTKKRRGRHVTPLLNVPAGQPIVCAFVAEGDQTAIAETHYLINEKRSIPCLGEECTICPFAVQWKAGIPCVRLRYLPPMIDGKFELRTKDTEYLAGRWSKATLQITQSGEELLDLVTPGTIFQIGRIGGKSKGPLYFHTFEDRLKNLPSFNIDARASLMRAWNTPIARDGAA